MKRRNFLAAVGLGSVATAAIVPKPKPSSGWGRSYGKINFDPEGSETGIEWAKGCKEARDILERDKKKLKKLGYTYGSIRVYDEWLRYMVVSSKYEWMWVAHANRAKHGIFLLPDNQMLGGYK